MALNAVARDGTALLSFVVSRLGCFIKYWLPVAIWMAIIFSASADSKSSHHSSRLIAPFLRWLNPDISEATVNRVVFAVRKAAHVTEYAVLSALLWRALRKPARGHNQPWQWSHAVAALVITALYCATDELHQAFVPNREARFGDVAIDILGGALGICVIWILGRWRKRW